MNPFAPADETLQIVSRDAKTGQVGTKTRVISYAPAWNDGFIAGITTGALVVFALALIVDQFGFLF